MALIELQSFGHYFVRENHEQIHALRDVTLCIDEGEYVCITGPSGSGKSTLLNLLGCLAAPRVGSYRFAGQDIQTLNPDSLALLRRKMFGFVFQSYNLSETDTALENVAMPGRYAGLPRSACLKRAKKVLTKLGLSDRLEHLPSELSGGEQQRVAIARALMNGGRVILADEPTGALDTENAVQVLAVLEEIARSGHTIILVTQDAEIAARAPRRIQLRDGRVVSDSGTHRSRAKTAHTRITGDSSGLLPALRMGFDALAASLSRGKRLRVYLSILGACVAVWLGGLSMILSEGTYLGMVDKISRMGLGMITVVPGKATNVRGGDLPGLTLDDALAIKNEVGGVQAVSPLKVSRSAFVQRGDIVAEFRLQGIVDRGRKEGRGRASYRMAIGEFISSEDDDGLERVTVLDSVARDRLFSSNENPIGQEILIRGVPFRVKGVYEYRTGLVDRMPEQSEADFRASEDSINGFIYIPFQTFYTLFAKHDWLYAIFVFLEDPDQLFEAASEIRDLGVRRSGVGVYDVEHQGEVLQNAKRQRRLIRAGLGTLAAALMAVASLSVMTTMLMAVRTRRPEIGLRMAVGARRRDIFAQFFTEALMLNLTGCVLGTLLALTCALVLNQLGYPIGEDLYLWVPFTCAFLVGLVSAIAPARRAACLDPVAALNAND